MSTATAPPAPIPARVLAIDAFRGATMILMLSEGFGLHFLPEGSVLSGLARQFDHEPWHGMRFWDLIQPFFMFIVGVAMPFSFARRAAAGEPWSRMFLHVLKRAALLILWGLVARSVQANRPNLDLINVLAQIAFTYTVAFLLLRRTARVQFTAAFGLLGLHWALYQFLAPAGTAGPWERDANFGWWLDQAVLGKNWGGSYATINCLSSAFNTIVGVWAGTVLAGGQPGTARLRKLAIAAVALAAAGLLLSPLAPVNKKIWTAPFALVSTGLTLAVLAGCYWWIELKERRRGLGILLMVGANSIFIYLFHEILHRWLGATARIGTGWIIGWNAVAGNILTAWAVLAFEIYVCWWLWRRKIFFRL